MGTRFVASVEGDAPDTHKEAVVTAGYHDTIRTLVFSGRPMRIKKNAYDATRLGPSRQRTAPASPLTLHTHPAPPARSCRYVMNWEEERGEEMRSALKKGKLPYTVDEERGGWTPEPVSYTHLTLPTILLV